MQRLCHECNQTSHHLPYGIVGGRKDRWISATEHHDSDGSITQYSINFGDGTVQSTASATHTYSVAGTFTVTATVTAVTTPASPALSSVLLRARFMPGLAGTAARAAAEAVSRTAGAVSAARSFLDDLRGHR